ncbi:bifunctional diguanylate cyclase/phosphodiesterase [Methylibium sp.]|uniref:bifunctional diguanylate cyclase/phosphodiesterase n=1 Tax=Methylibium sp. TaxID=2067992 RepID=UPI003D0B820B
MSLIRQLWLLLLATIVVGVLGSALVTVGSARGYLETQLRLKNSDNAQALALSLSQQSGDLALAELAISAQFDTGFYERISLLGPEGRILVERRAESVPAPVPAWFANLVPIASTPGVAQVSDGWRSLGTLEVVSASSFALADLWRGSAQSAGWLTLIGLLACALGSLVLRRIRAPLQATVEQARAIVERRFVTVQEPRVPELRQLSRAMNAMVQRLQAIFGEQGAQLEALRQQAQTDPLTGLVNRAHFLAQLSSMLAREDTPRAGGLLLLRVRDLAGVNRAAGHAAADALLQTLALTLRGASAASAAPLAGRLNGADFAMLMGETDARAMAAGLHATVKTALKPWAGVSIAIGAVSWRAGESVAKLMQAADAALVRAETQDGFGLAVDDPPEDAGLESALGESGWRQLLWQALERGDARLGSYPVIGRDGRLLHLECPLRLRLHEGGSFEPAARWLPWALRSQFSTRTDLIAVTLALEQIALDGQSRGVNIATDSLNDSGFLAELRSLVGSRAQAAGSLWLEVAERAAVEQLAVLRDLGRQLRPLGVKLGLEHAGERLARIDRLYEAGLDFVKLDSSLVTGIAQDSARADFVRGLAWTLHGLEVQVLAEGVADAADAQALWACGLDGITGPWASAQAPN